MSSLETAIVDLDEERRRKIEYNSRKLEELGIPTILTNLEAEDKNDQTVLVKRKQPRKHNVVDKQPRRSLRIAATVKVYKEMPSGSDDELTAKSDDSQNAACQEKTWDFSEDQKLWAIQKGHSIESDVVPMIKAVMAEWPPESQPDLSCAASLDESFNMFMILRKHGLSANDLTVHAKTTFRHFNGRLTEVLEKELRVMDFVRLRGGLEFMAGMAPEHPGTANPAKRKGRIDDNKVGLQKRCRVASEVMSKINDTFAEELGQLKSAQDRKRLENFVGRDDRFRKIVQELGGYEKAAMACACTADQKEVMKALDKTWKNRLKNGQQKAKSLVQEVSNTTGGASQVGTTGDAQAGTASSKDARWVAGLGPDYDKYKSHLDYLQKEGAGAPNHGCFLVCSSSKGEPVVLAVGMLMTKLDGQQFAGDEVEVFIAKTVGPEDWAKQTFQLPAPFQPIGKPKYPDVYSKVKWPLLGILAKQGNHHAMKWARKKMGLSKSDVDSLVSMYKKKFPATSAA